MMDSIIGGNMYFVRNLPTLMVKNPTMYVKAMTLIQNKLENVGLDMREFPLAWVVYNDSMEIVAFTCYDFFQNSNDEWYTVKIGYMFGNKTGITIIGETMKHNFSVISEYVFTFNDDEEDNLLAMGYLKSQIPCSSKLLNGFQIENVFKRPLSKEEKEARLQQAI